MHRRDIGWLQTAVQTPSPVVTRYNGVTSRDIGWHQRANPAPVITQGETACIGVTSVGPQCTISMRARPGTFTTTGAS